ncbi:MAG TPA: hypothetical protein VII87_11015, partial [Solirubrobacteraceae bacterium]
GGVKFSAATAIRAFLTRGRRIYAAGPVRTVRGRQQLLLSPLHRLGHGRYTLTLRRGRRVLSRRTVTLL